MKANDFIISPGSKSGAFYKSQLPIHPKYYLAYRGVVFSYWFTTYLLDMYSNMDSGWFFSYLSHWCEMSILVYFFAAFCTACLGFSEFNKRRRKNLEDLPHNLHLKKNSETVEFEMKEFDSPLRWNHYVTTIFFVSSFNLAVIVTSVFPVMGDPTYQNGSFLSVNIHVLNLVLMIIDLCINSLSVHYMQSFITVVTSACYAVMLISLHLTGARSAVYPLVDYKNNPVATALLTVGMILIAPFISHAVVYFLYRIKVFILHKIRRNECPSEPVVSMQI
uniref:Protein rolling stone n=1 Tax=Ciona savignyi TaxID=51511 RepID=H2ZLY5_CIOSA